jgi:hypothetical protein
VSTIALIPNKATPAQTLIPPDIRPRIVMIDITGTIKYLVFTNSVFIFFLL